MNELQNAILWKSADVREQMLRAKTDLERLLIASNVVQRLQTELNLSADAIRYLRETLAERDAEIARLRSIPFRRDMTQPMSRRE